MSNVYTLADIKSAMDKKYAPLVVDGITFQNVMRLGKEDRKKVLELVDTVNEKDEDGEETRDMDAMMDKIKEILALVADKDPKKLLDAIGDDLAVAMHIMTLWSEATQAGEADSSPS
mgnify:CR=1 FL=1